MELLLGPWHTLPLPGNADGSADNTEAPQLESWDCPSCRRIATVWTPVGPPGPLSGNELGVEEASHSCIGMVDVTLPCVTLFLLGWDVCLRWLWCQAADGDEEGVGPSWSPEHQHCVWGGHSLQQPDLNLCSNLDTAWQPRLT